MPTDLEARELVAQACRVLGALNLTKAATGHISCLADDGKRIFIRGRGRAEVGVRFTAAEQVITVDLDGNKIDGADGIAVPQEVFIHTRLYRARDDVRSVVHMHPSTVVLFTICDKDIAPLYGAYDPGSLDLILDGIPTFDRSVLIDDDQLGDALAAALGSKRVCLMRGHGITSVGSTVEDAAMRAIQLNEAAELNYQAHLLGQPRSIPEEDLKIFLEKKRQKDAGGGSPHQAAVWRYYVELSKAK